MEKNYFLLESQKIMSAYLNSQAAMKYIHMNVLNLLWKVTMTIGMQTIKSNKMLQSMYFETIEFLNHTSVV